MSPRKKKMKLYTVRVEMSGLCCPVWREVTIPSILVLHDVYRIILEAFGWDDESCYQFQFKKDAYIGGQENNCSNEINWYLSLESKPVGSETLEEVLGNSKVFNLVFVSEDLWCCHATVIKRESAEMDLFPFKCLAGEGACPSSLFERTSLFNEAYLIMTEPDSDPDAKEEVDVFLKENDLYENGQWPGEFDLNAANKRLEDLKERMKDELKEYMNIPDAPFDEVSNADGINPNWTSDWMKDVDNNTKDNTNCSFNDKYDFYMALSTVFDFIVELCKVHNIPCDGIDFNKKDFSQFDFDTLFAKMEKSPDPQMNELLNCLKPMVASYNDFMMNVGVNSNKTTEKKKKSKKSPGCPKRSKRKKSDDNDDNK